MKKKAIFVLLTGLIVAVAVGSTVAYFTKEYTSQNNVATASSFDVDVVNADGETISDSDFDLDGELFPGMEQKEVYQFQIEKNNTEVPVEYEVNLHPEGELFPEDGSSPVRLTMQKYVDEAWMDIELSSSFALENETEDFRILVDWPHSDQDIDFQGKTGSVNLQVVTTQVDEVEEPEGPPYYSGEVIFKATPNGSTRSTTDKEIDFYYNDEGDRVFEVFMGEDAEGTFEEKVGNVRVVEYDDENGSWIRVYTDHEYYASEDQMWRIRVADIDTSTEGVIRLPKSLGPYFSIESDALYDWFTDTGK